MGPDIFDAFFGFFEHVNNGTSNMEGVVGTYVLTKKKRAGLRAYLLD